jgi:predicted Zn-ribbon and HTH transcriptional regulator
MPSLDGWLYGSGEANPYEAGAGREAAKNASESVRVVRNLEDRVDRLTLVCSALWSLLREKTGSTEEELLARVREIDLSDGKLDGKLARPPPATCGSCGRTFSSRHVRCLWCGAERAVGNAFDRAR